MDEDPLRAADHGLSPCRQEDGAGDLAEAEGHDGQVVAAQTQDRRADA